MDPTDQILRLNVYIKPPYLYTLSSLGIIRPGYLRGAKRVFFCGDRLTEFKERAPSPRGKIQ